jgi:hypothetical protein
MLKYCDFIFRCGCTWAWAGGVSKCNIHNPDGKHFIAHHSDQHQECQWIATCCYEQLFSMRIQRLILNKFIRSTLSMVRSNIPGDISHRAIDTSFADHFVLPLRMVQVAAL